MTFIHTGPTGAQLHVDPANRRDGTPVIELSAADKGQFTEVQVLLDNVEELVAGIRDAARQASGQQPDPAPCGNRSLPLSSGDVVRCVLHTGHAGQCQDATEYPYVSWPNPSNGAWNPVAEAGLSDTQPANDEPEDQTAETTWSVVFQTSSTETWQEWSSGWLHVGDAVASGGNLASIATVTEVRFVRATTTRERFSLDQLNAVEEDETR